MPLTDADIIIFDCDSTLSRIEGIDELAKRAGVDQELLPLTHAAMQGEVRLEDIYQKRLDLIKPHLTDIEWLGLRYIEELSTDADIVVNTLQQYAKDVHIVSGGIRQAVQALATRLNIDEQNVHAVDIYFNKDGSYQGFNDTSPLTRTGGKKITCAKIIGGKHTGVLIGDGMTDLEARQERLSFIGYGGVVYREKIEVLSDHYFSSPSLLPLLETLLNATNHQGM